MNYSTWYLCFRESMSKLSSIPELKITRPGTRGSQFSWEEISMYLYGHKPVEPAVLEDQRKLVKLEENCQGLFLWKYVLCILIPFCSFLSFFFSFIYLLFPVIYKKILVFIRRDFLCLWMQRFARYMHIWPQNSLVTLFRHL